MPPSQDRRDDVVEDAVGKLPAIRVDRLEQLTKGLGFLLLRQPMGTVHNGEDRDADAQVPIEVDHAAPPSSLLARGKTVMAPTS